MGVKTYVVAGLVNAPIGYAIANWANGVPGREDPMLAMVSLAVLSTTGLCALVEADNDAIGGAFGGLFNSCLGEFVGIQAAVLSNYFLK